MGEVVGLNKKGGGGLDVVFANQVQRFACIGGVGCGGYERCEGEVFRVQRFLWRTECRLEFTQYFDSKGRLELCFRAESLRGGS